jgi:hypothetical protein
MLSTLKELIMAHSKEYGNKQISQPGGGSNATIKTLTNVANPMRSRKIVVAPCRTGPAYMGGNQPTAGMKNRQGR